MSSRVASIKIGSMTCSSCVGHVEKAACAVPGVDKIDVALLAGRGDITYDPSRTSAAAVAAAISAAGYEAAVMASDSAMSKAAAAVAAHSLPASSSRSIASVSIKGMTCSSCVGHVEKAACAVPGVEKIDVALLAGRGDITYDPSRTSAAAVAAAIRAAGYEVAVTSASRVFSSQVRPLLQQAILSVNGMTCSSCVSHVERELRSLTGVEKVEVALLAGRAAVDFGTSAVSTDQLLEAVRGLGYGCELQSVNAIDDLESDALGASVVATATLEVRSGVTKATRTSLALLAERLQSSSGVISATAPRGATGEGREAAYVVVVQYDSRAVRLRRVVDAVSDAGFAVNVASQDGAAAQLGANAGGADTVAMHANLKAERGQWVRLLLWSLVFAVPVLAISMAPPSLRAAAGTVGDVPGLYVVDVALGVLAAPVQFGVGSRFLRGAWVGVVRGRCSMGASGGVESLGKAGLHYGSSLLLPCCHRHGLPRRHGHPRRVPRERPPDRPQRRRGCCRRGPRRARGRERAGAGGGVCSCRRDLL